MSDRTGVSGVVEAVEEGGAAPTPPRTLIITVYGLYARDSGGWLSVASLVRLMAAAGVGESAVRSAVSRLKRRGVLVARALGGAAGYELSADALAMLADGDDRIFARPPPEQQDDDGWVLAIFSVPESDRARRHELRSRLGRLGFGTVAPGVWIAPAGRAAEAGHLLRRIGLDRYVQLFTGRPTDSDEPALRISEWWDLDRIGRAYADYVRRWRPVLARWQAGEGEPVAAFADYVHTLTEWRRLPYLDPGLPTRLLPADWPGGAAADMFGALHNLLSAPAREYARRLLT